MHTKARVLSAVLASTIIIFGASMTQAEEVAVETSAEVTVTTEAPTRPRPFILPRNAQEIRDAARERIEILRQNTIEQRAETRVDIRTASSAEERRDAVKEAQTERAEMRDRAQEIRGNLKERLQALVKTHVGAVIRRSENALNMFSNLVSRIESRITKLHDRGVDTTGVEASLAASVSLIASAKIDVEALKGIVNSVNEASEASTVKAELRTAIEKVTVSIKAAHASLLNTAKQLSELVRISASAESTTSVEVNN